MSSKKIEPESQPVFGTTLRYHLKPRPIEADLKVNRKDRRTQSRSRAVFVWGAGVRRAAVRSRGRASGIRRFSRSPSR